MGFVFGTVLGTGFGTVLGAVLGTGFGSVFGAVFGTVLGAVFGTVLGSVLRKRLRMKLITHEPGVYFGMPDSEYHADPSFSASVAKDMLVSPLTAWCQNYDPAREEDDDTPATLKGKATHKAVLEGMNAFEAAYAVRPNPDEYPNHARGGPAIKALCKQLGVSAGGTIAEMCKRIREVDAFVPLWPEVEAEFEDNVRGRIVIPADVGEYARRTSQLVRANPSIAKAVTGGYPEVSIFWQEDGMPWKSRIDYLKTGAGIDLKTFTNMHSKPLATAVAHAVAQHRYHVQAAIYLRALKAAKEMSTNSWHGPLPSKQWHDAFAASDPRFVFLFVESGRIPNVALREFREKSADGQETLAHQAGAAAVEQAARLWLDCMDRFGLSEPWVFDEPLRAFDDAEFPLYMTE